MPSFTITPVSTASAVDDGFQNFIQFQQDGTNLGLPDVDTVNLTDGITATRGTGESANVLTLTADSAPSGSISVAQDGTVVQTGVRALNFTGFSVDVIPGTGDTATVEVTSPGDSDTNVVLLTPIGAATFRGALYSDWTGTTHGGSNGSHWDQATQTVIFDQVGLYEVSMQASVATAPGVDWPATGLTGSVTLYGSSIPEAIAMQTSEYGRPPASALNTTTDPKRAQWHDTFIVDATTLPASFTPKVYADNYSDGTGVTAVFAVMLSVKRIWTP